MGIRRRAQRRLARYILVRCAKPRIGTTGDAHRFVSHTDLTDFHRLFFGFSTMQRMLHKVLLGLLSLCEK